MRLTDEEREELDNLRAFAPRWDKMCSNCKATPTVGATGMCGPCTFGEAKTVDGRWWSDEDQARYNHLRGLESR